MNANQNDDASSSASVTRRPSLLQQRIAGFDAAETKTSAWHYKLKVAAATVLMVSLAGAIFLPIAVFPFLIPADFEGLGLMMLPGAAFGILIVVAQLGDKWIEDRLEWYWFWKVSGFLLFVGLGAGGLYGIVITRDSWLVHMR